MAILLQEVGTMHDQIAQMRQQIEGQQAVIDSDAKALGMTSMAEAQMGNPNYQTIMQAMQPKEQTA